MIYDIEPVLSNGGHEARIMFIRGGHRHDDAKVVGRVCVSPCGSSAGDRILSLWTMVE
jgi:hypothetical protein